MEALTVTHSAFVVLLAIVIVPNLTSGYKVYWNAPSEHCHKNYNISLEFLSKEFGITMNSGDMFKGDKVTILYNPGLFPEIKGYKYESTLKVPDLSSLEYINGGLPQAGDMLKHLDALEVAINQSVPNHKNDGIIIIDMEHFGATWAQNFNSMEIYRIMSRKRIQDKNPTFTTAQVESEAKLEYERAAMRFIIKSIQWGKALRPYAKWGYYQYPQCFNAAGVDFCSTTTQADNDQMIVLWKSSDALFPSLYLGSEGTAEDKAKRSRGRVREANRAFKHGETQGLVIPYITYKYYFDDGFIADEDLDNLIKVPKEEGAAGVVVWGSSADFSSEERCKQFYEYAKKSIGPIAKKYITN